MPLAEAYAALAGDDLRPLLVLRECLTCTGTDDALLTRNTDNEQTMLMSRWFHCIKLPPDVLEPDHPFHALFEGSDPAHLFLSDSAGAGREELKGDQARVELWRLMEKRLASNYADKPKPALKQLAKVLDKLDRLDQSIARAQDDLDRAAEKDGPGSSKFKQAQRKLTELNGDRNQLRAEALRASRLAMREERRELEPSES